MSTNTEGTLTSPRRSRKRSVIAVLVVAGSIAAGLAYRYYTADGSGAAPHYVTAAVDRGPIEQIVTATGILNPVKTVQVGTYVSGPILAIDVDFNSLVKKGQRVAKIDAAPFTVKVRQAQGNLANSKAKVLKDRADLAFKKLQFERNKALLADKLISQNDVDLVRSDYDQATAQLALDQAAVEQAEAGLEEAQVNLRYTEILSPVDGVVVSRNVDVGQTVAASFQTPTLFLIAEDLNKMQVDTNVSESDVGGIRQGQPAIFTVDAYPGTKFHGSVAQIRNAPITVQNVVTYDVVVAVDNPELDLKPGMTANVVISTAKRDQALRLPGRALRFRPDAVKGATPGEKPKPNKGKSDQTTVYVLNQDETIRPVQIQVGIRDAQNVEVLGGELHEGDQIAVAVQRDADAAAAPQQRPPSFAGGGRRF